MEQDKETNDQQDLTEQSNGEVLEEAEMIAFSGAISSAVCECRMAIIDQLVRTMPGTCTLVASEVGMGRSLILKTTYEHLQQMGINSWYLDYAAFIGNEPIASLERKVRTFKRTKNYEERAKYIIIDNMPVEDDEILKVRAFLDRAIRERFSVIVGTLPEGEVLRERRYNPIVRLSTFDLCLQEGDVPEACLPLWDYTHNIPSLVTACLRLSTRQRNDPFAVPSFSQEFVTIVASTQRPGLMGEERSLIATMLILGKGTRRDLSGIIDNIDSDMWSALMRDEPLLGIDMATSTFSCVGSGSVTALATLVATLEDCSDAWADKVLPICRLLVARGQYDRAAMASRIIEDEHARCKFTFQHGFPLMNALAGRGVLDTFACAQSNGWQNMDGYMELESILENLFYVPVSKASCEPPATFPNTSRGRAASVARDVRAVVRGERDSGSLVRLAGDSRETSGLVRVGQALQEVFRGSFERALDLVSVTDLCEAPVTGVTATAGAIRTACTYLLDGGLTTDQRSAHERAIRALNSADLYQLSGVLETATLIPQALFGHAKDREALRHYLDAKAAAMDKNRDRLLYAAVILAMGIADARKQSTTLFLHTVVEFSNASTFFKDAGATLLANAATLLRLVTLSCDNMPVVPDDLDALMGETVEFDALVFVVRAALGLDATASVSVSRQYDRVPRNLLWLISVLAFDFGSFSTNFRNCLPGPWYRACQRCWRTRVEAKAPSLPKGTNSPTGPSRTLDLRRQDRPVRINLLGDFGVIVEGKVIDPARFTPRRAKNLLIVVGAAKSHAMRRGDVMENVFPGDELDRAGRLLNLATSWANQIIRDEGGLAPDAKVVCSDKHSGTVRFDPNLVVVDIDLFEELARRIGDTDNDDERVVGMAREIEELYRDSFCLPDVVGDGTLLRRDTELRGLFVDAMLLGTASAATLGRHATACRFVTLAYWQDKTREDVLIQLIKTYCVAGRRAEAERIFDEYAVGSIELSRRPADSRLRAVAASYFGEQALMPPTLLVNRATDVSVDVDDEQDVEAGSEDEATEDAGDE